MAEKTVTKSGMQGNSGGIPIRGADIIDSSPKRMAIVDTIREILSFSEEKGVPLPQSLVPSQQCKEGIIGFAEALAKDPARESDLVLFAKSISRMCTSHICSEERIETLNTFARLVSNKRFREFPSEMAVITYGIMNEKNRGSSDSAFDFTNVLLDSPNFSQELLLALQKITENAHGANMTMPIAHIACICEDSHYTPAVVPLMHTIAHKTRQDETLSTFEALLTVIVEGRHSDASLGQLHENIKGMDGRRIAFCIYNSRGG